MTKKISLSDNEFISFSKLIYKYAGIEMKPIKKALIEGRLGKRVNQLGLNSFNEYYKLINNQDNTQERQQFIDILTTNETWFFREENHFQFMQEWFSQQPEDKDISIWSAACSGGQEPYSLAMLLSGLISDHVVHFDANWAILATDISSEMIEQAKNGIYWQDKIRGLSQARKKRFMLKGVRTQAGKLAVVPEIKKKISFKQFNLINSTLPVKKFDIIFCRNVLIYFDETFKLTVVKRLIDSLKVGGYLVTGHAESLHSMPLENMLLVQPSVYKKEPSSY